VTRISTARLDEMKAAGEKIVSLTAYDASFATVLDEAGVEVILVGDSLGMVLHGEDSTLNVTMEDMIYHIRHVVKGSKRAMIIGDMPHKSYLNPEHALSNARRLIEEGGADVIKLERGDGSICEMIRHIVAHDISVCAHLGLTPQSIEELGGYKVQGRDPAAAKQIIQDALAVQEAGASILVLECVPSALAASITAELRIPVVGIGAGADCDGQVLVIYDLLGISRKSPHMAKNFLAENANIGDAIAAYIAAVKCRNFPDTEHSFK
jgi:3-methyl-2-oxobutanoate hydroxymethyltransferase